MMKKTLLLLFICLSIFGCNQKQDLTIDRVIIIIIDGVRNSDINADSLSEFNSGFQLIKAKGINFSQMYNNGVTLTQCGMSNIVTGVGETLVNNGTETSDYPNIFQHYIETSGLPNSKAWIISSKDKLETLRNTSNPQYKDKYLANTECGINGLGTGYRNDSITYKVALEKLSTDMPNLAFITFREPDYSGHQADWNGYKTGMKASLNYTLNLINYIQSSEYYLNRTLIIVTNDHGRHLDGIADGYISHGDGCDGCRHITMVGISPNIPSNSSNNQPTTQSNIAPTIARILGFLMPTAPSSDISSMK